MLTGSNKVGDRVQLGYSLGANFMDMRSEGLLGTARNMRKKDDWVLNSALVLMLRNKRLNVSG